MSVRAYLDAMAGFAERCNRPSVERVVLTHGRDYVSAPLTAEQARYLAACFSRSRIRFAQKQCFYNSQMALLLQDPAHRLTYVEGYAFAHFLPVLHGWLVLDGERVVDLTWRRDTLRRTGPLRDRVFGEWHPGEREYVGVPIRTDYVRGYVISRRHGGSVFDDMHGDFPLVTGATPLSEWKAEPTHTSNRAETATAPPQPSP